MTEERLAELERAAAGALDTTRGGRADTVLSIRADELLALCEAARGSCWMKRAKVERQYMSGDLSLGDGQMNAYQVVTTEDVRHHEIVDRELGGPVYYEPIGDLVFARSRGRARSLFCRHYDLEFTWPLTIKCVAKSVDRDVGIAEYNDILWLRCNGDSENDEDAQFYKDYPAHR